jgi:thiol-disulfide isomerase/thioredoxin
MSTSLLIARLVLAAVFAVAALAKLADRAGAHRAVADFHVPAVLVAPVAGLLPLAELGVAAALLPAASARWGAVGALALLAAFCAAIAGSMIRGEAPDCHCFGQLHSEPAGGRTLARNGVLAALAALVVAEPSGSTGPSALAWLAHLGATATAALAGGVALAAVAGTGAWFMLALLRQNGRLLLRVDELEARLDGAGVGPSPGAIAAAAQPAYGLPLGTRAPDFKLSGLYGETVTLEALTASELPLLLLFTDPGCGPCNALLPQIARWQHEHAEELTLAVLTRGSAQDNRAKIREHGVGGVWLDPELSVYDAYQVPGTPAAVVVDPHGAIASEVAAGADAITALVLRARGAPLGVVQVDPRAQAQAPPPVPAPPAPPPTLPVGSSAPAFERSDLDGNRVALAVNDRDTLVLFWNPGCGFCEQMLDDLRALEARPTDDSPRLVLVSAGSEQDNRAMGLRAPVVLDQAFATGRAFGITGTPSAMLVDASGRIASRLAVGAPAVMELAARSASGDVGIAVH